MEEGQEEGGGGGGEGEGQSKAEQLQEQEEVEGEEEKEEEEGGEGEKHLWLQQGSRKSHLANSKYVCFINIYRNMTYDLSLF